MIQLSAIFSPATRAGDDAEIWAWRAVAAVAVAVLLRLGVVALELSPLHFDEAQYWSYGEALAFGYYSKPPLAAWAIRASTEVFGDTIFGVRFFAPIVHGVIAWLLFATGRRLFDARTGFWACLIYLTLPAVAVSSTLMTTDPPMMAAWALALYALVRALEAEANAAYEAGSASAVASSAAGSGIPGVGWWALAGAAVGLGLLSKYTMIAFVGGALGYALLSRQGRFGFRVTRFEGPLAAAAAALAVFSPNLVWNAVNDFAAIAHVGDNANLGGGPGFRFDKALEFVGAQIAMVGPFVFAGLVLLVARGRWRDEWTYRLLLWLSLPLPIAMTLQAFLSRAHPNWAAPAYIAATLAVAAWALDRQRDAWLRWSVAIGLVAQLALVAVAGVYAVSHEALPRPFDPYKKMRPNPPICAVALDHLDDAALILSNDRRLLADCLFAGGHGIDRIRIWNADGAAENHYELVASLTETDQDRRFILVLAGRTPDEAERFFSAFRSVDVLEAGTLRAHASGLPHRIETPYVVARVEGFLGYPGAAAN